jgi:uncharacterized protein (TIGR00730 family)
LTIRRICVFCGSSFGAHPDYVQAAGDLGRLLAARGITLIYGGGRVGLMGEIARAVLAAGGEVIGVMPQSLADKEIAFREIDLRLVGTMHERKAVMAELAEAFVAMPGGLGTLEELAEILTWAQLDLHHKPCGLLNVRGYFDQFLGFLDQMVAEQFVLAEHRAMLLSSPDAQQLLDLFEGYRPPKVDKAAWSLKNSLRPAT